MTAGLVIAAGTLTPLARGASRDSASAVASSAVLTLRVSRSSPSDLELSGDLPGVGRGGRRYLTRDDLLSLPQVTYTVTDDANFTGATQVSGVLLEELREKLGAAAGAMVVAVCNDQYRANYPRSYIANHHPLLVLKVNGQPPEGWPKDSEAHRYDMGPFMISHAKFSPSFRIFEHVDEAQIPWAVFRLEFRDEEAVFKAIQPRGPRATDELVREGYRIAQQNCFRCHNNGAEGGTRSGHPWLVLSAWATARPEYFAAYVRDPQAQNSQAQMRGNPTYDEKTIGALAAYFRTFSCPTPVKP